MEPPGVLVGSGARVVLYRQAVPRRGDTVLVVRRGVPGQERYPIAGEGDPDVWLVGVLRVHPPLRRVV
jgi:hypothetical protein